MSFRAEWGCAEVVVIGRQCARSRFNAEHGVRIDAPRELLIHLLDPELKYRCKHLSLSKAFGCERLLSQAHDDRIEQPVNRLGQLNGECRIFLDARMVGDHRRTVQSYDLPQKCSQAIVCRSNNCGRTGDIDTDSPGL